jgi:NADH-quinone oxidoreductase subunit H
MYLFAVGSISVYAILMAGWGSNSKYAFFGAIRAAAQMISYEVSIGLILINCLVCVGSLNFINIVVFQEFVFFLHSFFSYFFNVFN